MVSGRRGRDGLVIRTRRVVVPHELGFARRVAHRVVFMDGGRIVETAVPDAFFSRPRHERTGAFLSKLLAR